MPQAPVGLAGKPHLLEYPRLSLYHRAKLNLRIAAVAIFYGDLRHSIDCEKHAVAAVDALKEPKQFILDGIMRGKVQMDTDRAQQTLDSIRELKKVSEMQQGQASGSGDNQGNIAEKGGKASRNEGLASTE